MMEHIIKNLKPEELGTVLIVLGLAREARLITKTILAYKLAKKQKVRARGESPNLLSLVYHHLPRKAMKLIYILGGLWIAMFVGRHITKYYLDKKLEKMKKEKEG